MTAQPPVTGAPLKAAPRYWLTPPSLYAELAARFGPFDLDPTPYPKPAEWDGLAMPWGASNYVNPPFRGHPGPTAFVRKAIAEARTGKASLLLLPVQSYVNLLLEAGATAYPLGRVPWLEVETGKRSPNPSPICAFHLPGSLV